MNRKHDTLVHEEDQLFFERELAQFLPDKIFDAHVHIWHPDFFKRPFPETPEVFGYNQLDEMLGFIHRDRLQGALFLSSINIPGTLMRDVAESNEWVSRQTSFDKKCRGLLFITPGDDPEWIRLEVHRLKLQGFKCYHTFAKSSPTWEADIPEYLPEEQVRIAHEEELVILLHMVKTRAVADPSNIHWIRYYCETYPKMKLILAHSARGHQPGHNLEGLPRLKGLPNLYFDTSAICEPMSHIILLRLMGFEHLLYGTDFIGPRGRCACVNDTFVWLYGDTPVWKEKHTTIKPVLLPLEQARALKWACWTERLSDSAIEDIFYNNAAALFGISG